MTGFHIRLTTAARGLAVLAAGGWLFAVAPASADDATDAAIRERIEARLAKHHLDRTADIRVEVRDGVATLSGATLTVDAQRRAEADAGKEAKDVRSSLSVFPERRSDIEIRKAVVGAILQYPFYGVFDSVELGVDHGVVVLRGSVRYESRKGDIDRLVGEVPGVREIRNEISVQPVSFFDDRLRAGLLRAIYGDERFVRYASMANPPIRIVVDRGRVTLTGYVSSAVERALLGAIANQSLAFRVDNQVKVDGEDAREPAKASVPI